MNREPDTTVNPSHEVDEAASTLETAVKPPVTPTEVQSDSTARFSIPVIARQSREDADQQSDEDGDRQHEAQATDSVAESSAPTVDEPLDVLEPQTLEEDLASEDLASEDLASAETGAMPIPTLGPSSLEQAMEALEHLRNRVRAQVLGRDEVIDLVLVALLSDGHVLLEDFPGSGKTTLAKALGNSILDDGEDDGIADFRRVQFTPDLLPSDVTGVSVFDAASGRFHFRRGPIFAHVVLADEINRTSPKVQAAMLEAMAEKQVTVDNVTYALDDLFFVIATQNPLDLAGTYPLPAAQLDRFLFKIRMVHIDRQSELDVLNTWRVRRDTERTDLPKVSRSALLAARRTIDREVVISEAVKECLVDVSRSIRSDERVLQGNSTRSMVLMLPALQALATLRGRDYVGSDDLETLMPRVLGHRVELAPGITDFEDILRECSSAPLESLQRSTLRRR